MPQPTEREIEGTRKAYVYFREQELQTKVICFGAIQDQEELIPQITEIHRRVADYLAENFGEDEDKEWYGVVASTEEKAFRRAREDEREYHHCAPTMPRTWHIFPT